MSVNKKIIANLILIFFSNFFISASVSQTSNPIRVGSGPGGETFAFVEDVNQNSTGFSIKLIGNFSTPMPTTKGDFVASIESYYSVVCQSKLVRLNRQILLTGPMGTGNILASAQAAPTWKPADPTLLTLIDAFCK